MNIDERIKSLLQTTFPDFSVTCEDWNGADRAIEKLKPPFIVYLLPTGGQVVIRNGKTWDYEDIAVAFITHVPRDANGDDDIAAYNEMKLAARQFVAAIKADPFFGDVEFYQYTTIFEQLADIVTGVMVMAQVREAKGICL